MSSEGLERLFVRTATRQLTWPPPDTSTSSFQEADPPAALSPHVAKLRWGHEWIPPTSPVRERIIPDGAIHLLFVIGGSAGVGPYGLALGATSEATVVELSGRIEHVEIELRPGAVPALLGIPAGELTGQAISLEDLWRDRAATLQDRLRATRDAGTRIDIVQQTLARALAGRPVATPPVLGEAIRRIDRAGGVVRVRALAAELGITDRRLEQLFQTFVGLSPKAACRLARLRATVELLAGKRPPPWAELALERGFSDQSHLANEFRALTGLAPRDFQRRAGFGFLQDRPARRR